MTETARILQWCGTCQAATPSVIVYGAEYCERCGPPDDDEDDYDDWDDE